MRPERATPENKGAEAGLLGAHGMSLTEHLRQRADIKKIFARLTIGIRVGVLLEAWRNQLIPLSRLRRRSGKGEADRWVRAVA